MMCYYFNFKFLSQLLLLLLLLLLLSLSLQIRKNPFSNNSRRADLKIFNEIILKVKNFSLSFRIFLKGKISKTLKVMGNYLESEKFFSEKISH